jgi:hypothetical protein
MALLGTNAIIPCSVTANRLFDAHISIDDSMLALGYFWEVKQVQQRLVKV